MKAALIIIRVSLALIAFSARAQVPHIINFQGRVTVSNTNFDGQARFKFALLSGVDPQVVLWKNGGDSLPPAEPVSSVTISVRRGSDSIMLGDTSLIGMSPLPSELSANPDVRLRVWLDSGDGIFHQLIPDQRIVAVLYALTAENVKDGSITTTKLADGAVTAGKIQDGTITASKFAVGAIPPGGTGGPISSLAARDGGPVHALSVDDEGRVGIGTENPEQRLDVNGSGHIAASLTVGGSISAVELVRSKDAIIDGSATFAGGSIGMGTTNQLPQFKLEVNSGQALINAHGEDAGYSIMRPDNSASWVVGMRYDVGGANNNLKFERFSNGVFQDIPFYLRYDTGDATFLGRLSVGTENLDDFLSIGVPGSGDPIHGATISVGTFGTPENAVNSYYFRVQDVGANATPFLIRGDGRVGIGTSAPQGTLDVAGTLVAKDMQLVGDSPAGQSMIQSVNRLLIEADEHLYLNPFSSSTGKPHDVIVGGGGGPGHLLVVGTTTTKALEITGGADFSERFALSPQSPKIAAGAIVSYAEDGSQRIALTTEEYDSKVAGVVSGGDGIRPGISLGQSGTLADGEIPVAMTGRVRCWADASLGKIAVGDLLTTSTTPGYAMKATDKNRALGAIIGKATSNLEQGRGWVWAHITAR